MFLKTVSENWIEGLRSKGKKDIEHKLLESSDLLLTFHTSERERQRVGEKEERKTGLTEAMTLLTGERWLTRHSAFVKVLSCSEPLFANL